MNHKSRQKEIIILDDTDAYRASTSTIKMFVVHYVCFFLFQIIPNYAVGERFFAFIQLAKQINLFRRLRFCLIEK